MFGLAVRCAPVLHAGVMASLSARLEAKTPYATRSLRRPSPPNIPRMDGRMANARTHRSCVLVPVREPSRRLLLLLGALLALLLAPLHIAGDDGSARFLQIVSCRRWWGGVFEPVALRPAVFFLGGASSEAFGLRRLVGGFWFLVGLSGPVSDEGLFVSSFGFPPLAPKQSEILLTSCRFTRGKSDEHSKRWSCPMTMWAWL